MGSAVAVKILPASIIETYFYDPATAFGVAEWKIGQPVVHIQPVTTTGTATTVTFTTRRFAIGGSAIGTSHIKKN
jgi:hypothetical protein